MTPHLPEAELNAKMIRISQQVVVVADSSKLQRRNISLIAKVEQIHMLITDRGRAGARRSRRCGSAASRYGWCERMRRRAGAFHCCSCCSRAAPCALGADTTAALLLAGGFSARREDRRARAHPWPRRPLHGAGHPRQFPHPDHQRRLSGLSRPSPSNSSAPQSLQKRYPGWVAFAGHLLGGGFPVARLDRASAVEQVEPRGTQGAVGVKIWKNIGMELRDPDGSYVMPDDPRLEPVFA